MNKTWTQFTVQPQLKLQKPTDQSNVFMCRWRRWCNNSVKLLWRCFKKPHAVGLGAGNPLTHTQLSHSKNHKTSGWSITGNFQSWRGSSSSSSRRSGWGKHWSQSCGCRLKVSCGRWEYLMSAQNCDVSRDSHREDTRTYWKPADKRRLTLLLTSTRTALAHVLQNKVAKVQVLIQQKHVHECVFIILPLWPCKVLLYWICKD